jgi:putative two-component system response regulator
MNSPNRWGCVSDLVTSPSHPAGFQAEVVQNSADEEVMTIPAPISHIASSSGIAPRQTVLVVDDTPENLTILGELLQPLYRVRAANCGARAIKGATSEPKPDLILLDVMMPDMDGYAVLEQLRADPRSSDTPVIFVTAMGSAADEERGLALGAVDYITKPIKPAIVLARVRTHLELKRARDLLKDKNLSLEAEVARRMGENQLIQEVSIHMAARLAETRDPETGSHLRRTEGYVHALACRLQRHPRFSGFLTRPTIDLLAKSAPLHDIGKVGIPDHILLKPGRLAPDEWDVMKTHAKLGSDIIEQAERDGRKSVEFLTMAKAIAHWHHERWDGGGYPDGLAGDAIPIPARLMALADVFDALISRRVYKEPMSFDAARNVIAAGRDRQFDPDVVDAFLADFDAFRAIAERHSDSEASLTAKL